MESIDMDNLEEYLLTREEGFDFMLDKTVDEKRYYITQLAPFMSETKETIYNIQDFNHVDVIVFLSGDEAFEAFCCKYIIDIDGERQMDGMSINRMLKIDIFVYIR